MYLLWVLLVGVALGVAGTWFVIGRLPRRSDDISAPELAVEADWISRTITERGGVAPVSLVEEILQLHLDYFAGPPFDIEPPFDVEPPAAEAADREGAAPRSRPPASERDRPDHATR